MLHWQELFETKNSWQLVVYWKILVKESHKINSTMMNTNETKQHIKRRHFQATLCARKRLAQV